MRLRYKQTLNSVQREAIAPTKEEMEQILKTSLFVEIGAIGYKDLDENGHFQVPKGVTQIGDGAFAGCYRLESVSIPEGVRYIGKFAFVTCTSLNNVIIPEGVTGIEDGTFRGCIGLINLTLPQGVIRIGNYAFSGCSSLDKVILSEGVTYIGDYAFEHCSNLLTVRISKDILSIGSFVFYLCSSLQTLEIPEGVTDTCIYAFYRSHNIKNIIIDSENIDEVERIKQFLADDIELKVVMKSVFDEASCFYQEVRANLASIPQFNKLYLEGDYLTPVLPGDALGVINTFLEKEEITHPLFRSAIQAMDLTPTPKNLMEMADYKNTLIGIGRRYAELVQNIKPSMKQQFFFAAKGKGDDSCYKAQWEHGVMAELIKETPRIN